MEEQLPFPYAMRDLTEEEAKILITTKDSLVGDTKLIGTRTCCSSRMRKLGTTLYNFKPRPDDIWLVGFPRSGTTLTQEILYLLGTDLNYEKAASEIMDLRFPVLHTALYRNEEDAEQYETCPVKERLTESAHVMLDRSTERRFIKSHFGFNLLHPDLLKIGCKIVFIARNIKDVMVSYSRYPTVASLTGTDIRNIWDWFKYELVNGGNPFEMLENAWKNRDNPNLLILFYEEVNADKKGTLLKLAKFLGKQLTDNELQTLLKHLKIENFRNNKSVNNDHLVDLGLFAKNENFRFIGTGHCGGWKEVIPQELWPEIDEWVVKNLTAIPDFKIPDLWIKAMDLNLPECKK